MLSLRNIVTQINSTLALSFNNAKFYGVAISVEREGSVQPQVNEMPVSFDDSYGLQVYHKLNGINISYKPGFGNKDNTINVYNMSAFIFNNEKITNLKSDEIAMLFQSILSGLDILSVRIIPVNVILNSTGIFATEYRGNDYPLGEYSSLMQMNYNVEMTFKSSCFDICPEDFTNCKIN